MTLSSGSKIFGLVLLSIIGGVLFALLRFSNGSGTEAAAGEPVRVTIPEGAAADQVATLLADAGVIDSALPFRLAVRGNPDLAARIQPGEYELRQGMGADEILLRLTEESSIAAFSVTIPEGLTVDETLERIADADGSPFTQDQLRQALAGVALPAWVPADLPDQARPFEGLLAPDSYEWRADVSPQELLGELVAATEQRLQTLGIPEEDFYDTLIIASLIEREVRIPDEQPVVSSVIRNRLDNDRLLQIDAAVRYATTLAGEEGLDTDIDSPWNVYEERGLPPTPIAAPGEAALRAAVEPADTDFLYYVVCDIETGEHAFTQTLEQHEQNRQQYLAIRDEPTGSFCDEAV